MKPVQQSLAVSLLCLCAALLMPLLPLPLVSSAGEAAPPPSPVPEPSASPAPDALTEEGVQQAVGWDEQVRFAARFADGSVREVTMAEFLPGVLAGEMPASFALDALRAQAVAARTYILSCMSRSRDAHAGAAVCTDPGCCQAWLSESELRERWGGAYESYLARIREAVAGTDGTCLTWEGEPILSCFHASSLGCTEDSGSVWSTQLPYLTSVFSPESEETVPDLVTRVYVSAENFRDAVCSVSPAVLSADPAGWVGEIIRDTAGRVSGVMLGGAYLSGSTLRELFTLRSTDFTLRWTGTDFLFTVAGYGHGVGMSQYGAQIMASRGADWREILRHYYPGAVLEEPGVPQG